MILSREHQMFRDAVRQYAREQLAPNAAARDRDGTFPKEALKALAAMGLYGIAIAKEWGGAGMDCTALALAIEEIATGDGATFTIIQVTNLATGNENETLLALVDGKFVNLRVPYPLGYYTKWMDGRVDDPNAGRRGKGI